MSTVRNTNKRLTAMMVCTALFCSSAYTAAAVTTDRESTGQDLDEYVITATRVLAKKIDTPANVVVINSDEIADNHYADMAEALVHLNGVVVTRQGSGTQDIVRINGDDRVVVLLDGQRLNNDMGVGVGRATIDLKTLPSMKNIARIEVVKGGGSALYGSDAVGGVINIITKKAKENHTTLDMNTGSWSTQNYELTNEGSKGDWDWFVTAGKQRQSYFYYKQAGNDHKMDNSAYDNNSLSLRADKKINDSSSLRFNIEHRSIDSDQYGSLSYPTPAGFMNRLTNNWGVTYNFKENTALPGYLRYYTNYTATTFQSVFTTKTIGLDFQDGWQLNQNNKLIAGFEYRISDSSNPTTTGYYGGGYDSKKTTNKALYAEDTMRLGDKWSFVPGIRFDKNSKYGNHTTPKAALNYKVNDKIQVYADWGRVFSAPQADDLYYYTNSWGIVSGNENLKPETGYTESLGVNYAIDNKTTLSADVFKSEIHDAIKYYSENYIDYYATNVQKEKKQGFELSLTKKVNSAWNYELGYSYINTKTDYANSGYNWDASNSQPNGYRLGVHYAKNSWKANLLGTAGTGRSTTRFTDNHYLVWDASVSYDFNKQWTGYLKVNNLTNQGYEIYGSSTVGAYPMAGRFIQLGMTYSL